LLAARSDRRYKPVFHPTDVRVDRQVGHIAVKSLGMIERETFSIDIVWAEIVELTDLVIEPVAVRVVAIDLASERYVVGDVPLEAAAEP
jgi:hypothetical protein